MRAAVLGLLVGSVALAGCIESPFGASKEALANEHYLRDVQSAVQGLSILFGQADLSIRSFQQGWLAPEGAASQFSFLTEKVKELRADVQKAQPPADLEQFHRQLGRGVSLTQQAMDAMQVGFSTGDSTYFELAQQKLTEARATLDRAVDRL